MNEKIIETQYDVTKKSKLRIFYDSYKVLIYSIISALLILYASINFYLYKQEKKVILNSEKYVEAKVNLSNKEKDKALIKLKEIIYSNDQTYSPLSLFLILNQNLIEDKKELSGFFDYLLSNIKLDEEIKNLLIYKRALFNENLLNESEVLESVQPLLNSNSLWNAHALLFLGDYFSSKGEYLKAKEFYTKVFSLENLHNVLYEQARSQLALISNE
tara:strand:- start:394 stop:1041 length:648 start_codon:yes stop_codon:yes gene_type:complete